MGASRPPQPERRAPAKRASAAPRISRHAAERWVQRVDREASTTDARTALAEFVASGSASRIPRWWTDTAALTSGSRFVYSPRRPGVCAVVRAGVVVTVLTQALYVSSARAPARPERRPTPPARPKKPVRREPPAPPVRSPQRSGRAKRAARPLAPWQLALAEAYRRTQQPDGAESPGVVAR